jgi:hypothetical protein
MGCGKMEISDFYSLLREGLLPRQWLFLFSDIQCSVMAPDISRPESELLAGMRNNHRYYVRHDANKGLHF